MVRMKNTITFKLFVLTFLGIIAFSSNAQTKPQNGRKVFGKTIERANPESGLIRCVSTQYEESLQEKNPERANQKAFEKWLAPKAAAVKAQRLASGNTTNNTAVVITVPVVVHVIHSGQAVGTDRNISDARVQSQITVLNQDFRKMLGTPGYNTNPVGADVEIEFCLAQTGPDGEATTGINRVNLGNTVWNESNVESILKPQTQWDPNRYFNIWVCQFGGNLNGILGYAQFPSASGLDGVNADGGSASTDGVIIDWRAFGTSTIAPGSYFTDIDKGRTATHEIGHSFGLRHIWGDNSSCAVNVTDSFQDYCPDTPAAATENYDCAAVYNSCLTAPGNDMVENYMDYSNDSCMNIFTLDQKNRMQAVLQNSIRRNFLNSAVCNTGQTYQYNGRLKTANLNILNCNTTFSPTLTLTNTGTVTMTSAAISYSIDNGTLSTYNWTGSLATNASATITLPTITTTPGNHILNSSIVTINGTNPDQYPTNNIVAENFKIVGKYNTTEVTIEIQRDIFGSETSWSLFNLTTGTTVASGSGYTDTDPNLPALFTQTVTVENNNCYEFTINDGYGDGICCDFGPGYYNLKTSNTIIATGGSFGEQEIVSFSIDTNLSTGNFEYLNNITLYPNPATDILNIAVSDSSQLPDSYMVYNSLGQILTQKKVNSDNDLKINTSGFSAGVYIIRLAKDNESKMLQFVKN